jgi:tetratricopeptide (TPR) repeat protein
LGPRTALVYLLLQQGQFDASGNEAKKILKGDERSVRAMQLLAQVYFHQSKYELAKMVLENARAIDPNDAATYNALGLVSMSLKARAAAFENFKQAVALKSDFAEAKNNLGAMLNESQDYESAARELEGAVNSAPDFAAARLNLGNAYRGRQEYGKALSQYKQVLRLKPELTDTYYNLAILHLDSEIPNLDPVDRLKTAIAYFDQFRQKGGKDDRIDQYLKDANKGIEKEQRRQERERKEQLRKSTASPAAAVKPSSAPAEAEDQPARTASRKNKRKPTPAAKLGSEDQASPAPKPAASSKLREGN